MSNMLPLNLIADSPTAAPAHLTCAVRLIDRRTGTVLRLNGSPLVLYTRNPDQAAADLLEGRDPAVWDVRVEHIEKTVRR